MINFQRGRLRGRGIILDQPRLGIIGIVECAVPGCAWRHVLTEEGHGDPDKLARMIEEFLTEHPCGKEPAS